MLRYRMTDLSVCRCLAIIDWKTIGGMPRVEEETKLTREDLYKSIWEKPATILAKELGISDVGLAKICKRLKVPRPLRGYWRQIEVGRKITIPRVEQAEPSEVNPAIAASIEAESLPNNRIVV